MSSEAISARRTSLLSVFSTPTIGPLAALVLSCVFFASQSDRFLSGANFSLIVQQVMVVGTLAIGQTLIILTAGIDLSNGMIMAFSQVVMAMIFVNNGVPAPVAILIGLLVAGLFGLANGLLVTRLKLPPFIVTLGMFNIGFALTRIYTVTTVRMTDSPWHVFFGRTFTIGETRFNYGSVLLLVLFGLTWFVLTQTAVGRHIYALGDDPEAARLSGIRTDRLLTWVYVVAGIFYGVAALLFIARTGVADPQAGQNANLESITAVVLGGTSLFGGRGSIMGTLIGALIVGIFRNGLTLMGVPSIYQWLITGALVILAVSVDQLTQRRRN